MGHEWFERLAHRMRRGSQHDVSSLSPSSSDLATETQFFNDDESIHMYQDRIEKTHKRLLSVNERKREIEAKRKELLRDACGLLREFNATKEKMDMDIEAYSKAWHRKIAIDICEKLPRELRDLIYDHLIAPHWLIQIDKGGDWMGRQVSFPKDMLCTKADYFGQQMAKEVVQRIYETRTFEAKNLSCASWLMRTDLFDLSVIPKHSIRELRIHLFHSDQSKNDFTGIPTLNPRLAGYMDKVSGAKRNEGFKLYLLLNVKFEERLKALLFSIAPFVYIFKKKKFDVKVFKYPVRGEKWDLTRLFDESPEECRNRIDNFNYTREIGVLTNPLDSSQ